MKYKGYSDFSDFQLSKMGYYIEKEEKWQDMCYTE